MAATNQKLRFPLCSKNEKLSEKSFSCLYIDNNSMAVCHTQNLNFQELLDHFQVQHELKLTKDFDYCLTCQQVFCAAMDGIEHYLIHALDFQQYLLEDEWSQVKDVFHDLNKIRTKVLKHILFGANDDFDEVVKMIESAETEQIGD